ncbi:MAG: tetratricopeptide repeat protein [Deltaproteobacteria bacterium]|nr:tetratricopeptide repeat protein [Deltaproteobacteria bacterium]
MKIFFMKSWIYIVLLSFVLTWPATGISWADPPPKSPDTYYNEGTEFLRTGDLPNAKASFTSSIDLLKDKTGKTDDEKKLLAEAYNNRGLAYYELAKLGQEQYSSAEDDFKDSYQWDPTHKKAVSNLALTYFEQKRYLDAKYKYLEALPTLAGSYEKPYHADVYNNLGVCYAETDDIANALYYYDKAIALAEASDDVDYTDAYFNKGNLYYNDKKYDQAITLYDVTIEYFEGTLQEKVEKQRGEEESVLERAYHNRALCYYNKGMYQEAINDFEKALDIHPYYAWAHYGKGYAHFMLDQNDAAIAEFTIINTAESGIEQWAQFGLGLAWCKKGDFDKGLAYLNQSCDSGSCSDACDTLKLNMYASPAVKF